MLAWSAGEFFRSIFVQFRKTYASRVPYISVEAALPIDHGYQTSRLKWPWSCRVSMTRLVHPRLCEVSRLSGGGRVGTEL